MKKSVLLAAAWLIGTAASNAQFMQLVANKDLQFVGLVNRNKAVFASESDSRLYATDATTMGTLSLSASITYDHAIGIVGNKILFKGSNAAAGSELFVTDGTTAGTTLLKDIYAGATGSGIGTDAAFLNGAVYFSATTAAEGREIWKSDGTTAGTTLLKDIVPGSGNSNIAANYDLFCNGSYLLFSAQTGGSGYELWKSDGTAAGTALLKDINPGAASSAVTAFFKLGNIVLFQADTEAAGKEVWKTDGTTGGTVLLKDVNPGTPSSSGFINTFFYELNGRAYWEADDGVHGQELWYTDGTTANTALLKDIQPGADGSFTYLFNAVKMGNKFIFASGEIYGTRAQLWQTDGTPAGTTLLKDFDGSQVPITLPAYDPNSTSANFPLFQGNKFFFITSTLAEGVEMWVCDGTAEGTKIVKDINPGPADAISSFSYQYTSNAFYFSASNGTLGTELWKTDGTTAGTSLVVNINAGAADANPEIWPVFNNALTFCANNGDNAASDLYVLDGSVSPLPIKLGNFTVSAQGNDGLLRWSTLQENNTSEFVVQRSLDGVHFQNIGSVRAAGQSTTSQAYAFTDAGLSQYGKDVLYYRLQVLDKDGHTELTKTVSLPLAGNGWSVKLVNNPVQASLQIALTGTATLTSLKITNLLGKSLTTAAFTGSGLINLPVQDLPAGVYFLTVENGKGRQTIKFMKN